MSSSKKQLELKHKLYQLLKTSGELISVDSAVKAWDVTREQARWFLYSFCKQGWLSRIKQGYYVPVDLSSNLKDPPLEHQWAIATQLWSPCYIGGWTACEHWDLTEQIFDTVQMFTTKQQAKKEYELNGTKYLLHTIQESMIFGTKTVWQGQCKVQVSNPTKTIVDVFYKPTYGGGIRQVAEFYKNYLESKHKDVDLLIDYALKFNKGVVLKRLGFITEKFFPQERAIIEVALKNLSAGYSNLDTKLPKDKLVSKWHLWISNSWAKDMKL